MKNADIFIFNSDCGEGWGVVLNEVMNSACAVVASHAIGGVPFLIDDGVNGMVYQNGDFDDFNKKVKLLIQDDSLRRKITKNAYETIVTEWSPRVAAERLVAFSSAILQDKDVRYVSGPCSPSENISEKKIVEKNSTKQRLIQGI